jgi:hypothetical protein
MRLVRPARDHWQFTIVIAAAIAMRIIVVLGYPPIFWFSDSYNYIYDAVTHVPDTARPNGYPFLLDLLLPLHSDYAIGLLQAAMGLAMGIAIYAVLRHRGLPWWGAALPTLPVLFDAYELHLEHMITADPLFIFLVTVAVVILCWSDRPSVWTVAIAGLLIGYATLVRSVGEPLLVVVLVGMLFRRVGWRRILTLLVTGIVPIGAYMIWFHSYWGQYTLTESGGFLYSRVSTFAQCSKMNVPPLDVYLCDPIKTADRPPAGEYIWADNEELPYWLDPGNSKYYTPLYNYYGSDTSLRFAPAVSAQLQQFAERAIEDQPMEYVRVVIDDTLHTFGWTRQPDPNDWAGNGPNFRFVDTHKMNQAVPWYATPYRLPGNDEYQLHSSSKTWCDATCQQGSAPQADGAQTPAIDQPQRYYDGGQLEFTTTLQQQAGDAQARVIQQAERDFGGGSLGFTTAVQPWAGLLQNYQRYVFLPGTILGVIVLIGLAGVLARVRRWGGVGLLPWLVGVLLIVLPPMTAGFSYRYVLAAVPAACLAAGLAFARAPGASSQGNSSAQAPDAGNTPERAIRR